MYITITGNLGSGKSTICARLNELFGFEIYSTGRIHRDLARRLGKSTLEMNVLMNSDPRYDNAIDDEVVRIAAERQGDDIVFDSRMAWNFVPRSFKVFLRVSIDVAAARIFADQRGQEEAYANTDEAKAGLLARAAVENERFKAMYGADYFDLTNYDLVIDTSSGDPQTIAETIFSQARKYFG
ncbi:MAG: cytidylate kinase family protein [Firmicutes bacterium]|nr:cytidylate kinase family protein [Bacillota bacterium]